MTVRNMMLAVLFSALAIPSFAQRGPGRPQGGQGGFGGRVESGLESGEERGPRRERNPIDRLEEALGLNAPQVASLQALVETNQATQEAIRAEVGQARENLHNLIEQGASATDIGNAVLGIHAIQGQAKASRDQFQTALENLLTAEQQGKLDAIQAAGRGGSGEDGDSGLRSGASWPSRRPSFQPSASRLISANTCCNWLLAERPTANCLSTHQTGTLSRVQS